MRNIVIILLFPITQLYGQVTSSFEKSLSKDFPLLNYSYEESRKTHDYSNNWDFDGDGITDSLRFVGNDATHVFYLLEIVFSSNIELDKLTELRIDFPSLGKLEHLKEYIVYPQFIVHDFNNDGVCDIYLNHSSDYSLISDHWLHSGLDASEPIIITIKDNFLRILNYQP